MRGVVRNMIWKKLKEKRGASLTFALLLFLICAVFGAVVLTAATAAAGRVSNLAEVDQKYYSVASAAELLAEELDDQSVTIIREKKVEETKTYKYTVSTTTDLVTRAVLSVVASDKSEIESEARTKIDRKTVIMDPALPDAERGKDVTYESTETGEDFTGDAIAAGMSFLKQEAARLMFGDANCNTDVSMSYSFSAGHGDAAALEFTLTHTPSTADVEAAPLTVKGEALMKPNGTITVTLKDPGAKDNYVLVLTLTAVFDETENTQKDVGEMTPYSNVVTGTSTNNAATPNPVQRVDVTYTEKQTTTTTTTKTSTITWKVSSIEEKRD